MQSWRKRSAERDGHRALGSVQLDRHMNRLAVVEDAIEAARLGLLASHRLTRRHELPERVRDIAGEGRTGTYLRGVGRQQRNACGTPFNWGTVRKNAIFGFSVTSRYRPLPAQHR